MHYMHSDYQAKKENLQLLPTFMTHTQDRVDRVEGPGARTCIAGGSVETGAVRDTIQLAPPESIAGISRSFEIAK